MGKEGTESHFKCISWCSLYLLEPQSSGEMKNWKWGLHLRDGLTQAHTKYSSLEKIVNDACVFLSPLPQRKGKKCSQCVVQRRDLYLHRSFTGPHTTSGNPLQKSELQISCQNRYELPSCVQLCTAGQLNFLFCLKYRQLQTQPYNCHQCHATPFFNDAKKNLKNVDPFEAII